MSLFEELKRRKLFRVVIAYVVASVGICPGSGPRCRQLQRSGLGNANCHRPVGRGPAHFGNPGLGVRSDTRWNRTGPRHRYE